MIWLFRRLLSGAGRATPGSIRMQLSFFGRHARQLSSEGMVRTAETELRILPPPPDSRSLRIGLTRIAQCLSLGFMRVPGWNCSEFSLPSPLVETLKQDSRGPDLVIFAFPMRSVSYDHEFVFDGPVQPMQS